jgi:hypothetical protein
MVPLTVVDGAGEIEGIATAIGKGHAFARSPITRSRNSFPSEGRAFILRGT